MYGAGAAWSRLFLPGARADPRRSEPESAPGPWPPGAAQKSGGPATLTKTLSFFMNCQNTQMQLLMLIKDSRVRTSNTFFFNPDPALKCTGQQRGVNGRIQFINPDLNPHSIWGSRSRREKISNKNRKNARKLVKSASLLDFLKVNLQKLHCFLLLSNL